MSVLFELSFYGLFKTTGLSVDENIPEMNERAIRLNLENYQKINPPLSIETRSLKKLYHVGTEIDIKLTLSHDMFSVSSTDRRKYQEYTALHGSAVIIYEPHEAL